MDFGEATPDSNIGNTLHRRNDNTGLEFTKSKGFITGGTATTYKRGDFTNTVIDTDTRKYDRSYWFMYPRFRNAVTPNKAYFSVPEDKTEHPLDTLLLPEFGTQGLPLTIQASSKMDYRNCGKDLGLTEYLISSVSDIRCPHSFRYTDSARTDLELLFYEGVWFKLTKGAYLPRAVWMNRRYFIAMLVYGGSVYSVEFFLIPKARLSELAKIKANTTRSEGTELFVGYDDYGSSVGRNAVIDTIGDALTLDCTEYSQGILMDANQAGFWDAMPYTCWPSPIDDNVFSTSWRGAPSFEGDGLTRHFEIVSNSETGVSSIQVKNSYPFNIPGPDGRSETYVKRTTHDTGYCAGPDRETYTGSILTDYHIAAQDTFSYTESRIEYNKCPVGGSISVGAVPGYQFMVDGEPLTVTVSKAYTRSNFLESSEDDLKTTQREVTITNFSPTDEFPNSAVNEYRLDTLDFAETFSSSTSWNGGYQITAIYSYGRQYNLKTLGFSNTVTVSINGDYSYRREKPSGGEAVTTVNDNKTTTTNKIGQASASGETPLVIDPGNEVQIWLSWEAGLDARRTALGAFVPTASVTAEDYQSKLPLNIISATLHIQIGTNLVTEEIYNVAGSVYQWNDTEVVSGSSNLPYVEPTAAYSYDTTTTLDDSTSATWASPSLPIPLLQYFGDGNPSNDGIYLCTKDYLAMTLIVGVGSAIVYGGGIDVYSGADPDVQAYRHKVFRLTRNDAGVITGVSEVDIQTEFGIEADAVFSWVFFA